MKDLNKFNTGGHGKREFQGEDKMISVSYCAEDIFDLVIS